MKPVLAEYKALLRLGFPVLLTELGIVACSFADTLMVGAYSTDALAAGAFVNNMMLIGIVTLIGFASGLTPIVGALYTAGRKYRTGRAFRASLQLNLLVAGGITLIMTVIYFLIPYLGQPPELLPLIRSYYITLLLAFIPGAVFNSCQQMANGCTDTALPMWVILGSNALNILGNYLLIFGHGGFPEMGLLGAGIATMVSRWAGAAVMLLIILLLPRYRAYRVGIKSSRRLGRMRRRVFATGYPLMLQSGIEVSLWSFGAVVCGWFGTIQLAAYQIVNTISQIGFLTYVSFGIATSIRVANYMGTRSYAQIRRATDAGMGINLLMATIASAIFLLSGTHLLGLFNDNAAVVTAAMSLMLPLVLYQYCDAAQVTLSNALRGTSVVRPLFVASVAGYIIVGVPAQLLLAVGCGMESQGVYYSFCLALLTVMVVLWVAYRRVLRSLGVTKPVATVES